MFFAGRLFFRQIEKDVLMTDAVIRRFLPSPPPGTVGVIGDFCTDVYWEIRPDLGETSIETGLKTTPVPIARYSPGGAGNIVANLRGLGLQAIPCFGAVGIDPFGLWLHQELTGGDAAFAEGLLKVAREEFHTPVYCKPLLAGREGSRFDLGNHPLTDSETEKIMDVLEEKAETLRVLIVNEQLAYGLHSACFRRLFADFVCRHRKTIRFVFDGRDFLDAYPGVTLKINHEAASRLAFGEDGHAPEAAGVRIFETTGEEMVITHGEQGCYVFTADGVKHIPAIRYAGEVDTVGAGDSFSAGMAYALANGATLHESAEFGTCCSAITIRKLNCTGAPSPEEMLALFA